MSYIKIDNTGKQFQDISLKSTPIPGEKTGESFSSFLKNAIDEVNRDPLQAEQSTEKYLPGRETNLYNALLSLEKSDLSYKVMMQVRQKLVDAYQQMRASV